MAKRTDSTKLRRSKARPDPLSLPSETLGEVTSIDSSHWKLCLHPLDFKRDQNPSLGALLSEAGANNPFFDPAFLMASRDRMVRSQIHQLILWEIESEAQTPKLSVPLIFISEGMTVPGYWKTVTHPFAPLGDPLIDEKESHEIDARFKVLLQSAFADGFPPIVLDHVSERSPLFNWSNANDDEQRGFVAAHVDLGTRPALNRTRDTEKFQLNKKRQREYNRLLNKLSEVGQVRFEKATNPFDVLLGFEEFLLSETRGWKGRNGTSIHAIKRDAAFARQSVSDLAHAGKCEIFSLRLDGRAIASIILFKSNGVYFPWKITFDNAYAKYSPGSQLMLRLSQEISQGDDFKYADSLAIYGKSWMSHLWPDNLAFKRTIWGKDTQSVEAIERHFEVKSNTRRWIKKLLGRR